MEAFQQSRFAFSRPPDLCEEFSGSYLGGSGRIDAAATTRIVRGGRASETGPPRSTNYPRCSRRRRNPALVTAQSVTGRSPPACGNELLSPSH